MIRSVITGTGSALPARRVSNAELAEQVDTSDEWIVERTGIRFRHIAGPDETTGTLAYDACKAALAAAGTLAQDIDLIVLATAIAAAAKMVRDDLTRRISEDLGNFEAEAA